MATPERIPERIVSMTEFARAMGEGDPVFAERVAAFEKRLGEVSNQTLGVLAQSAYICWFECEFEDDLIATCRAIGTGEPTSLYICSQISPTCWQMLNTYAVAVQRWLGVTTVLPDSVDKDRVQQVVSWLGPADAKRRALATLFLCHLVQMLTRDVSLSRLGADTLSPERTYANFSEWHSCPSLAEASEHAREALGQEAEDLRAGMAMPGECACQYRWPRKLDIKVCSIGALRWRGHLPVDSAPKEPKQRFWTEVASSFQMWLNSQAPDNQTAYRIHQAFGEYSDRKAVIIREFLDKPPPSTRFFDWIIAKSKADGLCPAARSSQIQRANA